AGGTRCGLDRANLRRRGTRSVETSARRLVPPFPRYHLTTRAAGNFRRFHLAARRAPISEVGHAHRRIHALRRRIKRARKLGCLLAHLTHESLRLPEYSVANGGVNTFGKIAWQLLLNALQNRFGGCDKGLHPFPESRNTGAL